MLFAVYDTETTGLPDHPQAPLKQQPRIIEFAGILTDGDQIIDEFEFICNPGIAIEPIITEITGLTNEDLSGKPDFETFIPQLKKYFGPAQFSIAHNAAFDRAMLTYDLERRKRTLEDISFPKALCTVEESFHQFGRRMKLQELYSMFFGEYEQSHRALSDVKALHKVAQRLGVYAAFN
jgi:DNA polymerase III epsilon subunit-like protein